jgi:AraC family transcriptional regulator of adaptative response/methylated-DNA-[protein]-cysteine methyltransferase
MYRAVAERDGTFEGLFVVAVRTTGVFCRPTCPARTPLRTNVEYYRHGQDAAAAGYRPCKRCRPLDPSDSHPEWVTGLLERVERAPAERITDRDLKAMGIDPVKVRRYFRHHFAMTFHAYQRTRRLGMALDSINQGGNLMHVAFNSGFESNSGFREAFSQLFGQPPGRARGSRHISATLVTTPIGPFITAATPEAVCMLEFGDRPALETQAKTLARWFDFPIVPGTNDPLERLREELDEYFEGRRTQFTVPLAIAGTPFQQAVWERLLAIPFGETTTYAAVARDIGRPGAQRAVGKANGDNRLAVLIPCHRVINSQGKLHGYGGGLWRKRFLLEHELGVRQKRESNGSGD